MPMAWRNLLLRNCASTTQRILALSAGSVAFTTYMVPLEHGKVRFYLGTSNILLIFFLNAVDLCYLVIYRWKGEGTCCFLQKGFNLHRAL